MVRFGKNGTDATSAAVRLSRAFTGRQHVIVCGYHGWQDWYIGSTSMHRGVPDAVRALTRSIPYNDLDALEAAIAELREADPRHAHRRRVAAPAPRRAPPGRLPPSARTDAARRCRG